MCLALRVYSPRHGGLDRSTMTTLPARDLKFGVGHAVAFNFRKAQISMFTRYGSHSIYSVPNNVTITSQVSWPTSAGIHSQAQPVFFGALHERNPIISAISSPEIQSWEYTALSTLTVTGANFGLNDLRQRVSIGEIECNKSIWLSDYAVACVLPALCYSKAIGNAEELDSACMTINSALTSFGGVMDVRVHVPQDQTSTITDRDSAAVQAIVAIETWQYVTPTKARSSFSNLHFAPVDNFFYKRDLTCNSVIQHPCPWPKNYSEWSRLP
jgi:hypothetical protein